MAVGRLKKAKQSRATVGLLSGSLASILLFACSGHESSMIAMAPLDSCAVVVIDWSSVRNDSDLKRLFKGNDFEALLQRLGLESSLVRTLVIFNAMDSQVTAGLLLRGSFDRQTQVSTLKMRGWQEESVDGHKVYVNGNDYAAMPQNNVLFSGTREAAVGVFRALNNVRETFVSSSSYRKITTAMTASNSTIKAFLVIPDGTLDMADTALEATYVALSLFDLGGVGALLKQINIASGFGLNLAHASNRTYPVEMCVLMRDERAAALISGSLNAMKGLSAMASTNNQDQETLRAFHSMNITRTREVLTIKMDMPQAALFPNPR